jgi:hypothetical protein
MISNSPRFPDVQNHWASQFIEELAARKISNGYPNGTFPPDNSVTREAFAAILGAVFTVYPKREYVPFMPNCHLIADGLRNSLYTTPAIVPPMSWQNGTAPPPPQELQVNNRRLSWRLGNNQPVRSWTLYREMGDYWIIQRILSPGTTSQFHNQETMLLLL